jgi:predicted porin
MTKLNKALMASTAIAFASGLALPASAQDPAAAPGVVASQKKVKITLYGQVSRIFGFVGDGESVTFKQGENGSTSSRMGIDGRGKINNDISLRTRLEFQVQSGDTGGGTQFVNQGGSSSRFTVRHVDVILSSKKFGAVWMGRGDSSSNGSSEVNLAGMDSARLGGSTIDPISEYMVMGNNSNVQPQAVATVDRFFNSFDGANRQNRIRYDTPTFFGFKGSVTLIDKHNIDSAIWYKGKIAGTELAGAIGYCHTKGTQSARSGTCFANGTTTSGIDQLNGSISFKTPIGVGASVSGGTQWQERTAAGASTNEDPYNISPSVFYTTKVTELGSTTFEYAFQYCESCGRKGDEGVGHSLIAMQRVDSIGGDYYVQFRYVDVETATNDDIEPLWYFGGGFRQRF